MLKAKALNAPKKKILLIEDMDDLNDNFVVDFDEETIDDLKKLGRKIELISKFKNEAC